MSYDKLLMIDDQPKSTITVRALASIAEGDLVQWNSGTDCVGSDMSTYASADICVKKCDTLNNCIGISLGSAASGNTIAIALDGIFILPAGSVAVTANETVVAAGYGNMVNGIADDASGLHTVALGKALTSATALTGFAIIKLGI